MPPLDETSRAELMSFADLLPEPLLLAEAPSGRVLATNRALREHPKLRGESLEGRSLLELAASPRALVERYLHSCSRSRQRLPGSLAITTRHGVQRFRVDGCTFRPRRDGQPAVVLLRLVPHEDSTARFVSLNQRIEALDRELARRLRAEAAARAEEERLRVTLASIGDAVIATDSRGRVSFLNAIAEALTGWSAEDAVGLPLSDVFRIFNEATREPVESPVDKVLRDGAIVGLANHTVLVARDGTERPIDDSGAPIRDDRGAIVGVILVFRDFTERKGLEQQLENRVAELAEAARRKDEFLAMLGHELRNPLAPVRTALELLRTDGADPAAVTRYCAIIERQVEHLVRLVDDLLDVSRITRGMIELRRERVELSRAILGALERTRPLIEQQRHHVHVEVPATGLLLDADPVRLEQIVANLLHNAAKYTDPGGEIAIVAARQGREVELRVRDNGAGIPTALLPNMFDLFVQGTQSVDRSKGGLGIGLTLVRRLVELHGGSIRAESAGPGQGAELIVRFPIHRDAASEPDRRDTPSPGAPFAPRRILVVDDNVDAATLLADVLERRASEVRVAHDGVAALDEVRAWVPDLVLLDIGLPGLDGYEVAREVRADPSLAHVQLVAISGYGQAEDVQRAEEVGFAAHLTKPVDLRRLLTLLESLPRPSS